MVAFFDVRCSFVLRAYNFTPRRMLLPRKENTFGSFIPSLASCVVYRSSGPHHPVRHGRWPAGSRLCTVESAPLFHRASFLAELPLQYPESSRLHRIQLTDPTRKTNWFSGVCVCLYIYVCWHVLVGLLADVNMVVERRLEELPR